MADLTTYPFDASEDYPWDCFERMAVSVRGCSLTAVPLVQESAMLPGFQCSWLQWQGKVVSCELGAVQGVCGCMGGWGWFMQGRELGVDAPHLGPCKQCPLINLLACTAAQPPWCHSAPTGAPPHPPH